MSDTLPRHLGLILDGNRRWARQRGLPTLQGHSKGYENLKFIAEAAFDRGVEFVSAYIFSTENWDRTKKEVSYLMNLALKMVTRDLEELCRKGIRIVWLGRDENVPPKVAQAMRNAEAATRANTRGTLALCFNYGGYIEIVDAFRAILDSGIHKASEITTELIQSALYYGQEVPAVDFLIRTSGEQRLSNFMLWRASYAELRFVGKHWPDFSEADLDEALADYASRHRRFGK